MSSSVIGAEDGKISRGLSIPFSILMSADMIFGFRNINCQQNSVEPGQPVETRTEGKTAEELISLVSKSSHAGTEENILGRGDSQNVAEDHQPQDCL